MKDLLHSGQLRETGDGFFFLSLTTSREWQMKKEPTNCKTSEARRLAEVGLEIDQT